MKIFEGNKEKFQPIELTIVIENKEELQQLWHRLNISLAQVIRASENGYVTPANFGACKTHDLWSVINSIAIRMGIVLWKARS